MNPRELPTRKQPDRRFAAAVVVQLLSRGPVEGRGRRGTAQHISRCEGALPRTRADRDRPGCGRRDDELWKRDRTSPAHRHQSFLSMGTVDEFTM